MSVSRPDLTDVRSDPIDPVQVRAEIDQTLRELQDLAAGDFDPAQFYTQLLQRVARVLGASGAAVWIADASGGLHLLRHESLAQVWRGQPRKAIDAERRRLEGWLRESPEVAPTAAPVRIASKIEPAGALWGLLTFYLDQQPPREALLGLQRFVDAAAAAATHYQSRHELRHWNQDRDALSRLHDFTMAVHRPWSAQEVLLEVANEGRRLLDCDRVAVAVRRGGRYRVVAASGVATLNRRSAELQKLEQLATATMRGRQAFFYDESPQERPPEIDRPLQAYLDESAARRMAIVPLQSDSATGQRPSAALVVEQMSDRPLDAASQSLWLLADHAAVAIGRATRLRRLPLVGPLLGVASVRQTLTRRWLPRWLLAISIVAGLVAALTLVQTDYRVRVTGQLTPTIQRHVFAPVDGIVVELLVKHGDVVQAGQTLATLKSPELQRETTRLQGAIATAEQKFAAARTARLEALSDSQAPSQGQLASQQLLVEKELATLRAEMKLLEDARQQLRVTSPIAGSVITWDVDQSLGARPVARGQRLLTVADLSGDWHAEFQAADRKAGPILEVGQAAVVRFVTAARPDVPHQARASNFRLASEPDPATGENRLLFQATLHANAQLQLRPGAQLLGEVECGRRSLAYVWLGELYEEYRRRFF